MQKCGRSLGEWGSDFHLSSCFPSAPGYAVRTFIDALKFEKAPSSHRGAEGRWRCWRLIVAFSGAYNRHFPLVPVQRQSNELPATTVGECRRRRSLRRHKGGRWTVRLISRHHVLQGGFSSVWCVLRRSGQSPSADTRGLRWLQWPRVRARWRFKHHVESGLSVVVEWRHHSNQAGNPRRATNPQSGGHRPKKRL